MKNHELLDLIGEVNEDYVLEAGNNVVKPRFRWKTLAACAACAALVLGAYPVYRAVNPPLHEYTVLEGGGVTTLDNAKAPAGGESDPSVIPGGAYVGDDKGLDIDGESYYVPGLDAPVQEKAAAQYDALMKNGGINPTAPNPDWYGGSWIDNSYYPEAKLAVAIVEGFRTPDLEAQIEEWCGGEYEIVFADVKYSLDHLYALQDPAVDAVVGSDGVGSCGIGVDVMHNCLGVDIYGDFVPDEVLAALATLDPDGDAIRVRLFTGKLDTLTDDMVKGPAPVDPEARATPAVTKDGEPVYHGEDAPIAGGATQSQNGAQTSGEPEEGKLAHYDLLPLDE